MINYVLGGSGIEVRIFRWAGFAHPSENPYKFRTTVLGFVVAAGRVDPNAAVRAGNGASLAGANDN